MEYTDKYSSNKSRKKSPDYERKGKSTKKSPESGRKKKFAKKTYDNERKNKYMKKTSSFYSYFEPEDDDYLNEED